ncbi:hypothetical protein J4G43_048085 [Bradyrhizobium barranii subsp. barranii]|uniref:Uncharacterized protein n=1 Tax=Bradyrhizobium barranii subsp. barranii TaxID=2823807 RepID=A0A939MET7_9BRAD|nr:hypothetical protein [Bradyrhizobium barranii]UEM12113.1 hypothetical protein J4G43_048085 [Bradyrhizobium barranii subsp. barranii]
MGRRLIRKLAAFELFARLQAGRLAIRQSLAQIGIAADDDEAGVAAKRKPVEPDALRIDAGCVRPPVQHIVDQPAHIRGALDENRKTVGAAGVTHGVAGMIERRNDEPGIGQSRGRVMVTAEPSSAAVRHHDEWKLFSGDRTCGHGEEGGATRIHLARWLCTRSPDQQSDCRSRRTGRNVEVSDPGGLSRCYPKDEQGSEDERRKLHHCSYRAWAVTRLLMRRHDGRSGWRSGARAVPM